MSQKRILVGLAVAIGLLVTASTVLASTTAAIRGNARANTIRGTAGSDSIWGLGGNDKLYGGAGNDKLYGGTGNDLLVGGPGADVLSCGAGNDRAVGGAGDKATKDCEHVTGIPSSGGGGGGGGGGSNPPPPAAACSNGADDDGDGKADFPNDPGCESASDTDETDPAPPRAVPGKYCGFSEQGPGVCVTTSADATSISEFESESIMDCTYSGGSFRTRFWIGLTNTQVPILPDRSFSYTYSGSLTDPSGDLTNMQASYFIKGVFSADGKADGTFAFSSLSADYQGVHFTCTQNPVGWHTTKQ